MSHDELMWFGGGYMWFFWFFLIVGLVVLLKWLSGDVSSTPRDEETPMSVLKKRYARGEIDEEEFERRRNELES